MNLATSLSLSLSHTHTHTHTVEMHVTTGWLSIHFPTTGCCCCCCITSRTQSNKRTKICCKHFYSSNGSLLREPPLKKCIPRNARNSPVWQQCMLFFRCERARASGFGFGGGIKWWCKPTSLFKR